MEIPYFTLCGEPISFYLNGLEFISLEDVKKFLKLNKNFSINDLKITAYPLGRPNYVNIENSIKEKKIVYYEDNEIQWNCKKDCDNCYLGNP